MDMQTVSDFSVGDKVRHPGGAIGVVAAIEPTRFGDLGVRVEWQEDPRHGFPKRCWIGHYDDDWMKQYRLQKIID